MHVYNNNIIMHNYAHAWYMVVPVRIEARDLVRSFDRSIVCAYASVSDRGIDTVQLEKLSRILNGSKRSS